MSDIENGVAEADGDDLEAAIEAAALAAANASSQTVTPQTLDAVHDYSNERGLTNPGIDMEVETRDEIAREPQNEPVGP